MLSLTAEELFDVHDPQFHWSVPLLEDQNGAKSIPPANPSNSLLTQYSEVEWDKLLGLLCLSLLLCEKALAPSLEGFVSSNFMQGRHLAECLAIVISASTSLTLAPSS